MNMRSQGYHFFSANQKRTHCYRVSHTRKGSSLRDQLHELEERAGCRAAIRYTTSLKRRPPYKGHLYNGHRSSANITV